MYAYIYMFMHFCFFFYNSVFIAIIDCLCSPKIHVLKP